MNKNINSHLYSLLLRLGDAYLEKEQFAEANEKLSQLIEMDPDNPEIALSLAKARYGLEDVSKESILIYEQALALNPQVEPLNANIMQLLEKHKITFNSMKKAPARNEVDKTVQNEAVTSTLAETSSDDARRELDKLLWNYDFDSAGKLAESSGNVEKALVLAYKHLYSGDSKFSIRNKEDLILLHEAMTEINPDDSFSTFIDLSVLKLALPDNYQPPVKSGAEIPDKDEYEFILGITPVEDYLDNQRQEQCEENPVVNPNQQRVNDFFKSIKYPCNGKRCVLLINIEHVNRSNSGIYSKIDDKLGELLNAHLSSLENHIFAKAGNTYFSFGKEPLSQINLTVKILRSLEKFNNAASPEGKVCLSATLFIERDERDNLAVLFECGNLLQQARRIQDRETGSLLLFDRSFGSQNPLEEYFFLKAGPTFRLNPISEQQMIEVVWRRGLESATEDDPYTIGDLEVGRKLASNKGNSSFLAKNKQLNRIILLKALTPFRAKVLNKQQALRDDFYRDIRRIGRLNHPNIATLFEMGEENGVIYYTREYVEGHTLTEMDPQAPDWEFNLANYFVKIAKALTYIHGQECHHLNLKPSNVFIGESNNLKIADFNIASFRDEKVFSEQFRYQAPELIGGGTGDAQCDIYSVGLICYECLTKSHPYTISKIITKDQVGKKKIKNLENQNGNFDDGWSQIVMKCLADKENRYKDAVTLMVELRELQLRLLSTEEPLEKSTLQPQVSPV